MDNKKKKIFYIREVFQKKSGSKYDELLNWGKQILFDPFLLAGLSLHHKKKYRLPVTAGNNLTNKIPWF